jgi:hypothetical protein
VTVTALPATVTVAVREDVVALAATVSVTDPPPLPLAGETPTQAAFDVALHAQPALVETMTLSVPPPLAIETLVGDVE